MSEHTTELLPCPFCGGTSVMALPRTCDKDSMYDPADRAFPIVRCHGCGAEAAGENWGEVATAIAAWNRRSYATALCQQGESTNLGCQRPPAGWWCSRPPGHDGPCAARPSGSNVGDDGMEGSVTLSKDDAVFLAARLRRLFKHFGMQDVTENDADLIGMAGSYIGLVLGGRPAGMEPSRWNKR